MRTPALPVTLALMFLVGAAPPARADPGEADDADTLIAAGVSLRGEGRDLEALRLFERALALDPTPRAIAQVALAEQALGRWVEAEDGLSRALSVTPTDPWIERNRPALEQALATVRAQLAWITVTTSAPGPEIRIEGRAVESPMREPARVAAGVVVVQVRAAGYEPAVRYVQVAAGDHAVQALDLVPLAPPAARAAEGAGPEAPSTAPSRPPTSASTAGWVSLGTAAALLGVGIAAHVTREVNAAQYDSPTCLAIPNETRDEQCGRYGSTARTATVVAIVGYVGAGVATLTSAYFFLLSGRRASPHPPAALSGCDLGLGGITCSVAF
jgi:tetratricopeptide (TPR) repeat protein